MRRTLDTRTQTCGHWHFETTYSGPKVCGCAFGSTDISRHRRVSTRELWRRETPKSAQLAQRHAANRNASGHLLLSVLNQNCDKHVHKVFWEGPAPPPFPRPPGTGASGAGGTRGVWCSGAPQEGRLRSQPGQGPEPGTRGPGPEARSPGLGPRAGGPGRGPLAPGPLFIQPKHPPAQTHILVCRFTCIHTTAICLGPSVSILVLMPKELGWSRTTQHRAAGPGPGPSGGPDKWGDARCLALTF